MLAGIHRKNKWVRTLWIELQDVEIGLGIGDAEVQRVTVRKEVGSNRLYWLRVLAKKRDFVRFFLHSVLER